MSENNEKNEKTLEERIKSLEQLQRNTRIAIIILVGYSIYDVISIDSGSEIIFAHKVKAREFELIDGQGTVSGNWKIFDKENPSGALVILNGAGEQVRVSPEGVSLTAGGRVNPTPRAEFDHDGIHLFEASEAP